jgi:hypothetical protein
MHLLAIACSHALGEGERLPTGSRLTSRRLPLGRLLVPARSGLSIREVLLPIAVAKGSAGVEQGSVVKDLVRVSQHRVPGRTLHEVLPFQGRTLVLDSKRRMHVPLLLR